MRNKSTVIALLLIFTGICIYNLVWTYIQFNSDNQLTEARKLYDNATALEPEARTAEDSLNIKAFEALRDDEDFNSRYQSSLDKSFTLGLDLQGGMFVTLEIGIEDIVRQLAGNPTDSSFNAAIDCASERQESAQANYVPLFIQCLREIDPNASLGALFASQDRDISVGSSDDEVQELLENEASSAIDRTFEVLRTRIEQFGVESPVLQKQESTGRIILELPGVKEPERVRRLIRQTAKLEFYETHIINDAFPVITEINTKLQQLQGIVIETDTVATDTSSTEEIASTETTASDTTAADTSSALEDLLDEDGTEESQLTDAEQEAAAEKFRRENPLFAVLSPPDFQNAYVNSPVMGYATELDTAKVNEYLRMEEIQVLIPDNMRFSWTFKPVDKESPYYALIAVKTSLDNGPAMGGDVITRATLDFDERNQPVVSMTMNSEGTKEWGIITENNVGKSVAILLDNYVYSYPNVNERIGGGRSQISGGFEIKEAQDLANVLGAGQLPVPARIEGEDVVGPTLGAENIRTGMYSFILAIIITLIFMFFYYARSGLVANVALIANLIFFMGCAAAFNVVLTLPGFAAIILTVGMAVDANVLIFERIREELKKSKTLKASIKAGFANAFSSVMDANITTFLTGVVLYLFGVGPIRGFAVNLMIGIITSLVSALIITRLILDYYSNRGKDSIQFGFSFTIGVFDKIKINMVNRRKAFYSISGAFVLIGIICFATLGFKTGVDFDGGRQFVVEFTQDGNPSPISNVEQLRSDLGDAFTSSPVVKTLSSDHQLLITISDKADDNEATDEVEQTMKTAIEKSFGDWDHEVIQRSVVGPTVANDIQAAAQNSVLFGLLIIFIYILIRFRKWQYSAGAIAAIIHDVIIVLAIFSILGSIDFGVNMEVNQHIIAAILTIIGYSINDTVVVFDRIRENLGEMKASPLKEIYNTSIDQTISRTMITSFTTFLVSLLLFLFGGDSIKGFMFAIMIGVIVGTYSSIFVASPIAMDMLLREEKEA